MRRRMIEGTILGCAGVVLFTTAPVAAQGDPCTQCGPGPHWVDGCDSGQDVIENQRAVIGIDINLDCEEDVSLVLGPCGDLVISRSGPLDDSANFPGLRAVDGHADVLDTEMLSLCLTGDDVTLIAGAGLGQGGVLAPSLGAIAEQPGADNEEIAYSFFDVFFEVDLGSGSFAYNQTALRIEVGPDGSMNGITCVPPEDDYIHPTGCLGLFTSPFPGQGMLIANLVSAQHNVNPRPVPTVSEWGLIIMTLLALTAGTIVFSRRRRPTLT